MISHPVSHLLIILPDAGWLGKIISANQENTFLHVLFWSLSKSGMQCTVLYNGGYKISRENED